MAFKITTLLASLLWLLPLTTLAHNIQLRANSHECFHENLHRDDKMAVSFQVGDREFGGAGSLEIDFWVCMHAALPLHTIPRVFPPPWQSTEKKSPHH